MEKIDISMQGYTDTGQKEQVLKQLLSDPMVKVIINRDQIPLKVIQMNTYTFKRWKDETACCIGCKGLKYCKQKKKGFHPGLNYDGILQETVEACKYQTANEKELIHLNNLLISDLPEAFQNVNFEQIDLKNESPAYMKSVITSAALCEKGQGAYLYGKMGSGKSYLAACAVNFEARSGSKVCYIHYPSFCVRISELFYSGEYHKEVERCKFCKLLVIDDIGAEEVTEKNRAILLSILDARMQNGRMTWFTSNQDFKALKHHFLSTARGDDRLQADRIMERVQSLAQPVKVEHENRRKLFQIEE